MPVDPQYNTTHPINVQAQHYGCHSTTRSTKRYYWATNRLFMPDGSYDLVSIRVPVTGSTKCRSFNMWDTDPMCQGCTTLKEDIRGDKS